MLQDSSSSSAAPDCAPYVASLPVGNPGSTLFWEDDELASLEGSQCLANTMGYRYSNGQATAFAHPCLMCMVRVGSCVTEDGRRSMGCMSRQPGPPVPCGLFTDQPLCNPMRREFLEGKFCELEEGLFAPNRETFPPQAYSREAFFRCGPSSTPSKPSASSAKFQLRVMRTTGSRIFGLAKTRTRHQAEDPTGRK